MKNVTQPTIVQSVCKEDGWHYELHIPENLIYFKGHFDELPIVPGVTQLKWVMDFSRQDFGQQSSTNINKLKFMRPILPDQRINLSISLSPAGKIDFKYFDDDFTYSQGQICYE